MLASSLLVKRTSSTYTSSTIKPTKCGRLICACFAPDGRLLWNWWKPDTPPPVTALDGRRPRTVKQWYRLHEPTGHPMLFAPSRHRQPNSLDLRLANRPAHLDYLNSFRTQIVLAGPLLDDAGEKGRWAACWSWEFADRDAAEAFGRRRPLCRSRTVPVGQHPPLPQGSTVKGTHHGLLAVEVRTVQILLGPVRGRWSHPLGW